MRRWIFGVLATFGVIAVIAVPLLTGSGKSVTVHGSGSGHWHTAYATVKH